MNFAPSSLASPPLSFPQCLGSTDSISPRLNLVLLTHPGLRQLHAFFRFPSHPDWRLCTFKYCTVTAYTKDTLNHHHQRLYFSPLHSPLIINLQQPNSSLLETPRICISLYPHLHPNSLVILSPFQPLKTTPPLPKLTHSLHPQYLLSSPSFNPLPKPSHFHPLSAPPQQQLESAGGPGDGSREHPHLSGRVLISSG